MFIKDRRQTMGLSQESLAEKSKLSLRTIQRAEAGYRISYASMRALAAVLEVDVDDLERELYAREKITEYKDYPLWLRWYLGAGWFSASRQEFKKVEIFFLLMTLFLGIACAIAWHMEHPVQYVAQFGSIMCLLGAYNVSISIRIGDKYDVWSKLEATLPKPFFRYFSKNKE